MPIPPERESLRFWSHLVIFAALVQIPFYPLLPWGLPIAMTAAAIAWRESRVDEAA
jgi:hypothetical protein